MKMDGVKGFTFKEMALATDNFSSSTQVGRGGYGKVYRGILSDNSVVAIKRAEEGSLQGQKEFLTEIKLLSRLHHRNLVSLVGYCDEEEEQVSIMVLKSNVIVSSLFASCNFIKFICLCYWLMLRCWYTSSCPMVPYGTGFVV